MILVDTSVWIDYLRSGEPHLEDLLRSGRVMMHPFVVGEISCGNLKNRSEILELLGNLPEAEVATNREVLHQVERRKLMGRGIGYVDVHLLASVTLSEDGLLWTKDRRLSEAASEFRLAYAAP